VRITRRGGCDSRANEQEGDYTTPPAPVPGGGVGAPPPCVL
jgi:hypothetical protein